MRPSRNASRTVEASKSEKPRDRRGLMLEVSSPTPETETTRRLQRNETTRNPCMRHAKQVKYDAKKPEGEAIFKSYTLESKINDA